MVEGREDFGFALKASEAIRVAGLRGGQHLDRHRPLQIRVGRAIDLAHPANADLRGDGVDADRWEENPYLTETHAAYERRRMDGTFIEGLRTAPDFFEPPSADTLRPARAAEFLYQMVAIDAGDAILCAKISPNATFTDL